MSQIQDKVRSLLIPVHGGTLLLPNVAVAEVVDYRTPQPTEDGPPWLLGFMDWRGLDVPLISFEVVRGDGNPEVDSHARVAVVNTIKGGEVAFYALLTTGIPRLVRVAEEDVMPADTEESLAPGEAARVLVNGAPAVIPDLDTLESLVADYLKHAA